jgi:hypothetical protein
MKTAVEERQLLRRDYVSRFLTEFAISANCLAESTRKELDEWARQVLLIDDQPSANWRAVVLHLAVAVECQLAASLGRVQTLTFFGKKSALGTKVMKLRKATLDSSTEHQLAARGINPAFVRSELADLMSRLAASRNPKIHGSARLENFTTKDANEMRQLAGLILRGCQRRLGTGDCR